MAMHSMLADYCRCSLLIVVEKMDCDHCLDLLADVVNSAVNNSTVIEDLMVPLDTLLRDSEYSSRCTILQVKLSTYW